MLPIRRGHPLPAGRQAPKIITLDGSTRVLASWYILMGMRTDELDYPLPASLIARHPVYPRDRCRLLVYRRAADSVEHLRFDELPELLTAGDLMAANDARVLPAKLRLRKPSGGLLSGLFLEEKAPGCWQVMLKTRGRVAPGMVLSVVDSHDQSTGVELTLCRRLEEKGRWIADLNTAQAALALLEKIGGVPLPPYIEKARAVDRAVPFQEKDAVDYQTVYACSTGSLACPTAGLHFTPELLAELARHGVQQAFVTLHVGLGTFLPVRTLRLENHTISREFFSIGQSTVERIRRQRAAGRRMVVVGTTTVRALETAADEILDVSVPPHDLASWTDLLIQPGFTFRLCDALITNFHLPRSTLLALVAALVGLERLKDLYRQAIRLNYRFYSYGDAMLILP